MVPFHSCFCNGIQNKPHPWTLPNEKIVLSKRVSLWIKILLRPDPISRSKYPRQNKLNGTFRRSLSQNALPRLFFFGKLYRSIYYYFWFCVFLRVLCVWTCVFLYLYVFLMIFFFFCIFPIPDCFCFYLYYLLLCFVLGTCLFSNEKQNRVWIMMKRESGVVKSQ